MPPGSRVCVDCRHWQLGSSSLASGMARQGQKPDQLSSKPNRHHFHQQPGAGRPCAGLASAGI
eukprot:7791974-Ditylum_brightwellii.AAC.1